MCVCVMDVYIMDARAHPSLAALVMHFDVCLWLLAIRRACLFTPCFNIEGRLAYLRG